MIKALWAAIVVLVIACDATEANTLDARKAADGKWLKLAKAVKPPTFTVSSPDEIGTRAVKRGDVIVKANFVGHMRPDTQRYSELTEIDNPYKISVIYKHRKVFEEKTQNSFDAQILRDGSVFVVVWSGGTMGNYDGFHLRPGSGGKWSKTEFGELCCFGEPLLTELMGNGKLYLLQSGEMLNCCNMPLGQARHTHSVIVYELRGKRLVKVTEPKVIRRATALALARWYRATEEMAKAKQDVGGQTARRDIAATKAMVRGSRNRISIDLHAQGLLGDALGYVVLKAQLGEIRSAWKVFRDDMGFHKDRELLENARKALHAAKYITEENELPLR